jgi:small subunit ribosomal protein S17
MVKKTEEQKKQVFRGRVISDKMEKTIVVAHERTYKNSHVHKIIKVTKKYKVHDERSEAGVGDIVEFYEGRPLSKTKYMYLAHIVTVASKSE